MHEDETNLRNMPSLVGGERQVEVYNVTRLTERSNVCNKFKSRSAQYLNAQS